MKLLLSIDVTIRLYWIDDRVRLSTNLSDENAYVTLSGVPSHGFWLPDVYIEK